MYETEAHLKSESSSQVPAEVLFAFNDLRSRIVSRTLISWGEHCTECSWPTCYSTCDLYEPRQDLKCRRFVEGMVRVDYTGSLNRYLLKIRFKRWGKLWARGNFRLYPVSRAERLEQRDYWIGATLQKLPLPNELKRKAIENRHAFKKRLASRSAPDRIPPTSFVLECYNPQSEVVRLSLRIRSLHSMHSFPNLIQLMPGFRQARELTEANIAFETLIDAPPGFHRTVIPFAQIAPMVDLNAPFGIDITPNEVEDGTTLYFGTMDFVQEIEVKAPSQKTIKCVVWDLDNTLWDGILAEDGPDKLVLRPGIRETIEELDRRGILQSVASKNNEDEALAMLKRAEIDEFFLVPQISWRPKGDGIQEIARLLNIGLDSLLFVDDSEFEISQVSTALPDVRTMNAGRYMEIVNLSGSQVPVSAESRERRKMYRIETQRKEVAASFSDNYIAFLRNCAIELNIRTMTEDNLERVHELTQRTNQMNFSGNRYDRDILRQILSNPDLDTYVLEVEDRFGTYGVVGFCIVDSRVPLLTDLMFSCRIQSKRVEHAFLAYLTREYIGRSGRDFQANYRKTTRNAFSGKVFADTGMAELENKEGVSRLILRRDQLVVDDGVVTITVQKPAGIL